MVNSTKAYDSKLLCVYCKDEEIFEATVHTGCTCPGSDFYLMGECRNCGKVTTFKCNVVGVIRDE